MQQGRLPQEAIDLLKKAAQTPVTRADPLARIKAIEKTTQRIKDLYPNHFLKVTQS
jgi:hypothetical protein